ncbi:MAG: hypothetical protein GTN82_12850 [Candidatus Aminicenantes bacterium]|nr:hypothetical protein [Candidatus Aminicenantes bacterium]
MTLVCTGASQYKDILESKEEFQEIEKKKAKQWENYTQYGGYGIYLYFIPSPLCAFFNNTNLFTELTAHVDVGERLNIHNSFKGKEVFAQKIGRLWDFSGVILLLGSLTALYFGYDGFRHREYLKFLASLFGYRKVFPYLLVSRIILLSLFIVIVTAVAVAAVIAHGIEFTAREFNFIFVFLLMMLLMMIFFVSIGTITGSLKSGTMARFFIILIWIGSVYFIPALINRVIEVDANFRITSNYQSEQRKVKILMDFERKVNEEKRKLEPEPKKEDVEAVKKRLSEEYLEKEFKTIQSFEKKLEKEMRARLNNFQFLSALFPSAFYLSVNNEISSRGYESVIDFHRYAREIKDEYMKFYVKKKYSWREGEPVESFVKNEENLYKGKSLFPWNFWLGLFMTLLWIGLVLKWSYAIYQKSLFSVPKEVIRGLSDLAIDVEQGKTNAVLSRSETIRQHLYNVLSGQNKEFNGYVLLEGKKDIVPENKGLDFVYICHPDDMPGDIKAGHFLSFAVGVFEIPEEQLESIRVRLRLNEIGKKSFGELRDEHRDTERGQLVLEAACFKKSGVYLIDNLNKGMHSDFMGKLAEKLKQLKQENASILYLSNDVFVSREISDYISTLKSDAALISTKL